MELGENCQTSRINLEIENLGQIDRKNGDKKMKKIIVSILVMGLLLSIAPINVDATESRINIYVDDDNTEGPWDGTPEHPYQHIQDGIDAANDGDIIHVREGTYYDGYYHITKQIKLYGENNRNTIIESDTGLVFHITDIPGGSVTINGFTIEMHRYFAVGVYNGPSSNVVIEDNIFIYADDEAEDQWCSSIRTWNNAVICNNKFINAMVEIKGSNNVISRNEFSEFIGFGVGVDICGALKLGWSTDSIIKENTFSNNRIGLSIDDSTYNQIYYNNFIDNGQNVLENLYDVPLNNIFDDGEGKGNYYSDYTMKYPDAQKLLLKGIWDTPYEIDANFWGSLDEPSFDRYPLIWRHTNQQSVPQSQQSSLRSQQTIPGSQQSAPTSMPGSNPISR